MANDFDRQEKDEFFDPIPENDGMNAAQEPQKTPTHKKVAAVLAALLIALVSFLAGWLGRYYALDEEVRTFLWAKSVAEKNYYQTIDEAELYQRLYDLLDLDPYSELFTPEEYADYAASGAGQNVGAGIALIDQIVPPNTVIPRLFLVVENSPACAAGLRKGMYIFSVASEEGGTFSGTSEEIIDFLSAQKGTFTFRCGYEQDGSDAREYALARRSYQAAYVHYRDSETSFRFRGDGARLSLTETEEPLAGLDAKTAYLRLDEFSGNAAGEFALCLAKMKERGRTELILDLRTNGGGYLDILGDIASHLMKNAEERNPVVCTATYRNGKKTRYLCSGNDYFSYFTESSHVYLLADENTASASECLIGVLVDYGTTAYSEIFLRENSAGEARTYGKGIMQSHYMSASGAMMKLTVATVNWPVSDRCIHGVGVTPADGAVGIPADLVWGKSDPMLEEVIGRVCSKSSDPSDAL